MFACVALVCNIIDIIIVIITTTTILYYYFITVFQYIVMQWHPHRLWLQFPKMKNEKVWR